MLERLAQGGLVKGKTIGVDSTTLEANAAMKSSVRRDTGESYVAYLKRLAEAEGIEAKDAAALLRMDRKRKKKTSNEEWQSPSDGDAEITKLKDGRTALAYKAENAVDMETGAIVAVTTHSGAAADTTTMQETVMEAGIAVAGLIAEPTPREVSMKCIREAYRESGGGQGAITATRCVGGTERDRSADLHSQPDRGTRNWNGKESEKESVYGNRRRVPGRTWQAAAASNEASGSRKELRTSVR